MVVFHNKIFKKTDNSDLPLTSNENIDVYKFHKVTPRYRSFQWSGWNIKINTKNTPWVRMSAWIKFVGSVPPKSGGLGFKIQGVVHNDWLDDMEADVWNFVHVITRVEREGDKGWNLFIFDSMPSGTVLFANPTFELYPEEPKGVDECVNS